MVFNRLANKFDFLTFENPYSNSSEKIHMNTTFANKSVIAKCHIKIKYPK